MEAPLPPDRVLEWYLEAGVDETIGEAPIDRYALVPDPSPAPSPSPSPAPSSALAPKPPMARQAAPEKTLHDAYALAESAGTVEALRRALESFEGCSLKKTAMNLVFGDGDARARILFVGEAPGAEEDRRGLPFVGPSGLLLDRMLASIGLDRNSVFITNTVFWRPPGNRTPTPQETALCLPFLERLVEIIDPEIVVTLGGAAAKSLLAQSEGVGRLRGRWFSYSTPRLSRPVQATALYHPAYLLRTPAQKKAAWRDLLAVKRKLDPLSTKS